MKQVIIEIQNSLMDGDAQEVKEKTEKALKRGVTPKIIIQQGLLPAMKVIGQKFRENEIFIPDVLMSSRAMHASLYVLKPILSNSKLASRGRIIIGTVAGDLHDIGKNMVTIMFQGAGYDVEDVGIDVPATKFIELIREFKPDILALSSLLTTTMGEMREVVALIIEEGLRDRLKIIVGGGPITPDFALAIGADAFAADSFKAVTAADHLMEGKIGYLAVT